MGQHDRELSRRVVLRGAAVTGVTAPLLSACASGNESPGTGSADGYGAPAPKPASPSGGSGAAPGAGTTVATSDVPVGGGTVLADDKIVVTQPKAGEFKAFSAVCTHQGCAVQSVSDGRINCPCHGSAFSIEDGSVLNGPATRPLEGFSAKVQGDSVTVT